MQVASPFDPVPADTVDAGTIVVLTHRDIPPTAALTVQRYGGRSKAFLLLSPTTDEWGNQAGILEAHVFGARTILRVPGATAVVPGVLDAATFQPRYEDVPPGALAVADDGRYLVSGLVARDTRMMWALRDGEEMQPVYRAAWFPTWDIAVPDVNGKLRTLCTIQAPIYP